jgi:hypothetical protein
MTHVAQDRTRLVEIKTDRTRVVSCLLQSLSRCAHETGKEMMECVSPADWLLFAKKSIARLIQYLKVPNKVYSIIYGPLVGSYRCGRWCPNPQGATLRAGALIVFAVIFGCTDAAAQRREVNSSLVTENLTELSPELIGNQWGWHLTRYRGLDGLYKIEGRTFLMLSTDFNLMDNVIWDPLTGLGRHFDHDPWVQFTEAYRQEGSSGLLAIGQGLELPGNRTAIVRAAPGVGMPSCGPNFNQYFDVYDASRNLLRSFYVVTKIVDPLSVKYHICIEGSGRHVDTKPNITIEYDAGILYMGILSDGTMVFMDSNKNGTTIVRLDNELQQHTSIGGRMFVLDAAGINAELGPSPDIQDPAFRYRVFLRAIQAAKNAGLH